jgi:uncharacterized protein
MTVSVLPVLTLTLASLAAGIVNALAGGGTLLTFPAIMSIGISAVSANATNAMVVCPGFVGGVFAQRHDLSVFRDRLWKYLAVSSVGGFSGGALLLLLGERFFQVAVPFLLLGAVLLLAFQEKIRANIFQPTRSEVGHTSKDVWSLVAVGLAAVYGGFFGAGMGVILLAVLGLTQHGSLKELNALKQTIAFTTNLSASILFIAAGRIVWPIVLLMGAGTILGGYLGGKFVGSIRTRTLRGTIVGLGAIITIVYFLKIF